MSKDRAPQKGAQTSIENGPGPTALSGRTVVLVEDEAVESKLYTKILEDLGAKVVSFESPEAMLEASAAMKMPALILTDILGPGKVDGIDLLRRLQQQPQWCRVPALIMTSTPTAERVAGASELTVPPLAFLAKPVPAMKLSKLVVDALSDRSPVYVHKRLVRERKAMYMEATAKQQLLTETLDKLVKNLTELETTRKVAQANYRRLSDALNRASQLSPELVEQLRTESAAAQLVLDETNEEIARVDTERTRHSNEKKRHSFHRNKELDALDERIRSVQTLVKFSAGKKAA